VELAHLWQWYKGIRLYKTVNALNHNQDNAATSCYWWYSIWERDYVSRCNAVYCDVNLKEVFINFNRGPTQYPCFDQRNLPPQGCYRSTVDLRVCVTATRQTADFITTSLQCQPVRRSHIASELRLVAGRSLCFYVLMPSCQSSNAIITIYYSF